MNILKTKWLFCLLALVMFFAGQSSIMALTINGHAKCPQKGWVPQGASVKVFEVDPVFGGGFDIDEIILSTVPVVDENGDFSVTFPWTIGGGGFEVCGPDLIFRFIQNIDGSPVIIYQENASETHWNMAHGDSLTFKITSPLAVCTNPGVSPGSVPPGNLFLFTRIGVYETDVIDCKGSAASSEGYCHPRKDPRFTGTDTDMPFGHTLDMFGWFGQDVKIAYYKVKYSTDGGSTWTDIETPLPNKWYDTSDPDPLKWKWVSESMGPFPDGGEVNLYKIPWKVRPGTPWSYYDRVIRFNTKLAADGLCRVKVIGYKWSGGSLVKAKTPGIVIDLNYGEIVLQIDNTPPEVTIFDLRLNGISKQVCDILTFESTNTTDDTIRVYFRVWDQRGHLREYGLAAMYGHNCYVGPTPTSPGKAVDNYKNNSGSSPSWQGDMSYSTEYKESAYGTSPTTPCTSGVMPTCAYQFRLHASKRTTNGYGLIYDWVEDTWHVTIQRK
jgi:hypothetical protein